MEPATTSSIDSTIDAAKRRACANCTAAKTKCTRRAGEHHCERCTRLEKRCIYLDLPQARRKQRTTRRLDGLESRFDGLAAQLSASPKGNNNSRVTVATTSSTSSRPVERDTPNSAPSLPLAARSETFRPSHRRTATSLRFLGTQTLTTDLCNGYVDIVDRGILTEERAEALLADFRLHHVPLFPFVVPSFGATAKVRQESPLLFLVAIAVALCTEPALQKLLGEEFQAIISLQLPKQPGSSSDAIQALLVFTAWQHYFTVPQGHSQLFLQTQLCVASVYHLNLDMGNANTSTEIRALLGTYYLSASISRALRRPPTMKYSKRIREYCERLAVAQEYETDRLIRPLVLSESLCCRVSDTFGYDDLAAKTSMRGNSVVPNLVDGFMNELELLKMLSATAPVTSLVDIELSYIQSYIQEAAFHDELWYTDPVPDIQENDQFRQRDLSFRGPVRTTILWRMLESNKACIRHVMAAAQTTLLRMPTTVNLRFCYVLANLIRLTFTLMERISVPGQRGTAYQPSQQNMCSSDTAHPTVQLTPESAYVLRVIDEMVIKFETCSKSPSAAIGGNNPIIHGFVSKLRKLSSAYLSKLQIIGAGLGSSSDETEIMADCLNEGSLEPVSAERSDRPHANNLPNEGAIEPAQQMTAGMQPDSLWLSEEAQGFNFDEREWESILESFTLPE